MKAHEAAFFQSTLGKWYRYTKRTIWTLLICLLLGGSAIFALVPSCHFLDTPAAQGCSVGGISFDGILSAIAFFNIFLILGIAVILDLLKMLLMMFWKSANPKS